MTDKQRTLAAQLDAGLTSSAVEGERHRKPTRRDVFLAQMDKVVPWFALCALIEPAYPKLGGAGGRPPMGLERMLRMYFLQHWYNLSDPAVEESLYDSQAMRRFVGIDLGREAVPDETTLCKFRHLLEGRRNAPLTDRQRETNRTKSSIRAKVEHVFFVIKRVFDFTKVRYRGLDKNAHRLFVTSALANLFMVRRQLIRLAHG